MPAPTNQRKGHDQKPFNLDEVNGLIEVYETLHGKPEGRKRVKQWASDEKFTEPAFARVRQYIGAEPEKE
jgi:hypothetical protein